MDLEENETKGWGLRFNNNRKKGAWENTGAEIWHFPCCHVVILFIGCSSPWRTPQRPRAVIPTPSPRWCSPTPRTHTRLQSPESPAATPSLLPSSRTPGTGWAFLRWGKNVKVALAIHNHCSSFVIWFHVGMDISNQSQENIGKICLGSLVGFQKMYSDENRKWKK